jgi:hypothetical protein
MNSIVPFDDEQSKAIGEVAKLGTSAVEAARDVGGYAVRVLGHLPEDLVGLVIGDRIASARWENAQRLGEAAKDRLRARGVKETAKLSPSLAAPLLDAASDESDEALADLWARLLANAMDPARARFVRQRFIEILKRMDPPDAVVFSSLPAGAAEPNTRDFIAGKLGMSPDAVEVSFHNLREVGLVLPKGRAADTPGAAYSDVYVTVIGREFARAVEP